MKAVLAGLALVATIAVTTYYGPKTAIHCTNRFIDRLDCDPPRLACGYAPNQEYCPDRRLSEKEVADLMSLPVEDRPPFNPNWMIARY